MAEIKENDEQIENVEDVEVWKSYPEFSNYLF